MRLVASSDPGAVARWNAGQQLDERVVLTTAVVRELQRSGGADIGGRSRVALDLLRRWVGERYEGVAETHARDGLADMVVPEGYEDTMRELTAATAICEALAMAWTPDTRRELDSDIAEIKALVAGYAW